MCRGLDNLHACAGEAWVKTSKTINKTLAVFEFMVYRVLLGSCIEDNELIG